VRFLRPLLTAAAAIAAAAALAVVPAHAATSPVAASGVANNYENVCDTNWVKVHIPKTSYFNFYNAPTGQADTCIKVMLHHLDFGITSISYKGNWGYPNLSSGWESGIYSCAGISGACFKYPVEEKRDGNPVTSVATWQNPGIYNAAYDIWFNQADAHPVQDNGTEVMIWIAHPGIGIWDVSRYVTIDGIRWAVMTWTARNARLGISWHYVAYVAVRQRTAVWALHLNPFFANAIQNGELSRAWWLTGIDFGFELVKGTVFSGNRWWVSGLGNNVHYFYLKGLPATKGGR
jgi:hypothetical protein